MQPQAEEEAPAPDLMAALEASLAEVRSGDSDDPAPAKKPAAKSRKRSSSTKDGSGSSSTAKNGSGSKSSAKSGSGSSSRAKSGAGKSRAKSKT